MTITYERVKELFDYHPDGYLVWKVNPRNSIKIGKMAGSKCKLGYISIMIDKKHCKAHRAIWLFHYGKFPENLIDHINGIKDDNRIENLREANFLQNSCNKSVGKNNKLGFKGVCFDKHAGKYRSFITVNRVQRAIGTFESPEDAHRAYVAEAKKHYGEFANDGTYNK